MNIVRGPGSTLYALVTIAAAIGGVVTSMILVWGFAYGGTGSFRYNMIVTIGVLGTASLLLSTLGASSNWNLFPLLTFFGSAALLVISAPYVLGVVRVHTINWFLLLLVSELGAFVLSLLKLKQLSY